MYSKKWKVLSKLVAVILLVELLTGTHSAGAINHCQTHHFNRSISSTVMQFTKEAVNQDYAILGEFKSLHCCAKNYRSIEWYVPTLIYIYNYIVHNITEYPLVFFIKKEKPIF